jgi:hypothetical protein
MSKHIRFSFLIIFCLSSWSVFGQSGKIKGLVTNQDGNPIEFANISVKGTSKGAVSTASGSFEILGLSDGQFTVTASSIGFEAVSQTVTINSGGTVEISFSLQEVLQGLQTVEITGRREIGYDNK